MSIAHTLHDYMMQQGVRYEVTTHPHTLTSMETAAAAHVPGDELAKAVILEDDDGYVMAVVPATHHVKLGKLRGQLGRNLRLALERDFSAVFSDCEAGAIPPLGMAYGMPTLVDDSLAEQPDVYLEAGDHEGLIHLERSAFQNLLATAQHGRFSSHI